MRKYLVIGIVAGVSLAACSTTKAEDTAAEDTAASEATAAETTTPSAVETTTGGSDTTVASVGSDTTVPTESTVAPVVDDRAPGVTDTEIKIGVTYVDLSAVPAAKTNHGDYQKTFNAVIDDINAKGGINGRKLVPVFSGVNPIGSDGAAAACTKIAQDEQAFAVLGFFQADSINCYLQDNPTVVIGGNQTDALRAGATVPWFSPDPSSDIDADSVRALSAELGDKLAVVGTTGDEALYEASIEPALKEAGITPIDVAYVDTTGTDSNATTAAAQTVAEKLKADGVEQVLLFGDSAGGTFPQGLAKTDFRPQLVFTRSNTGTAYAQGKGNDLSVLTNAIAGGAFDPNDAFLEMGGLTKDCLDINTAVGLTYLPISQIQPGEPKQGVSTASACRDLYLFKAIADKAGKDLNFGTFWTAGNNLGEIELPFFDAPLHFGPGSAADGNQASYTYAFDAASLTFTRTDG